MRNSTNLAGRPLLLIVDDDPLIADTLAFSLDADFNVITAASREDAIAQIRASAHNPDLALVDLGLPPIPHRPDEGLALISELLSHIPALPILVLSGQDEEANARHARARGAVDFVPKPADPQQLRQRLLDLLTFGRGPAPDATLSPEPDTGLRLIGESPAIQRLQLQLKQYADSPFPVLIEGESGSGKEIVAKLGFHIQSLRHDRPYLALNCAAISPTLVEPTLFGYAKGSFTGASSQKTGYFEDAATGTLFLDEIGELPLELQAKLLRVLENGEFQRVGETQTRTSHARIIAATNRDLRQEVREGRFRADLYHRLSVFTIAVPPLREMGSDRMLLLEHFRQRYAHQTGLPPFILSPEAEQRWMAYAFPGNVRELRNIVIRLTAKHQGGRVSATELESEFDITEPAISPAPAADVTGYSDMAAIARQGIESSADFNLDRTLRDWERAYIEAAQHLTQGNMSQTARLLGLNRTTLYNRLESLSRSRGS
ncbi:MAG: sigma-54-dependent Fis family transcriptional regulator [Proteobacteria bacterium]|nr:sigma-54-dependent Fis family transcriptional regulator [Pseudomonadota bacterium]HQR03734.1 sigma-54 dependent transcriptional regulator [Rhodocyclaceae bacterium]